MEEESAHLEVLLAGNLGKDLGTELHVITSQTDPRIAIGQRQRQQHVTLGALRRFINENVCEVTFADTGLQ